MLFFSHPPKITPKFAPPFSQSLRGSEGQRPSVLLLIIMNTVIKQTNLLLNPSLRRRMGFDEGL